jgi:GT2 family glycosyltransferase
MEPDRPWREPVVLGREQRRLLNDDAYLESDVVSAMVDHFDREPETGIIGCLIRHTEGTVNHAGVAFTPRPLHIDWGKDETRWTSCPEVQAITFACAGVRRELYEHLGGLDERYVYGYEDTDFCLMAREEGAVVKVCLDARLIHDEKGTRTGEENLRNYGAFYAKWHERLFDVVEIEDLDSVR